jgi:uncharacterized protein YbaP (TraB family)
MKRSTTYALLTLLLAAPSLPAAAGEGSVFMWRVQRGETTVDLLGSIHAMKPEAYPLPPAIEAAFAAAEVVVFEVDLDEMNGAAFQMLAAGSLDGGRTLEQEIGPDLWGRLTATVDGTGLAPAALQFMKPWMAALSVAALQLAKAGYQQSAGLDVHLSQRAKESGKERQALETMEEQLGLFTGLSPEESTAFLRSTLDELATVVPLLDEVAASWRVGEVKPVEDLLGSEFSELPALRAKLVVDRNRAWLERIEALLAGDRDALVVVGALHLVGPEGLVALLRGRGYTVSQL